MHPWNNSSQIIIHPDQDSQVGSSLFRISLSADDSESHDDAVLQERISSSWSLLSFFSKKLSAPAPSYSAFNREILAAYPTIFTSGSCWKEGSSLYLLVIIHCHMLCLGFLCPCG